MYHEGNLFDVSISEEEIISRAMEMIRLDIYTLFVPPYYLDKLKCILPDFIKLICPIDYPYGLGDTSLRQHSCLSAIARGASILDLVVNPIYIHNREKQKLIDSIKACKNICNDKKVELRIILDYRMFPDGTIYSMSNIISRLGIEFIIPSTGHFVDDFTDNLIISQAISNKNPSINTICNIPYCSAEQYNQIKKAEIYGARLKSFEMVYNT